MPKVAIVTGGASGMGLAVATALSQQARDHWQIHILDLNAAAGQPAATSINATFHQCNLTDYSSIATKFQQIYRQHSRLDFVHANAGILEQSDFVDGAPEVDDDPPPFPDLTVLDINLKGVITTSWLALHYFRLTRKAVANETWEGNLVMTASIVGLYASFARPLYTASKYGVIGLMRAMAPSAFAQHNVRVNCICPGAVHTGMTASMGLPESHLTPIENIARAVLMLIGGKATMDSYGTKVEDGQMYGHAVEVSRDWFRFRDMHEYSDEYLIELCGGLGIVEK